MNVEQQAKHTSADPLGEFPFAPSDYVLHLLTIISLFRDSALDGRLRALDLTLYSDGGWSLDLSDPVLWRALFHCDNAYLIPALDASGYVCKTHKTSQTAFRGFGGPQGMIVIEDILDRIARTLGLPPHVVRERNFYREGDVTHYGQTVKDASRIGRIWD